MKTMKNKRGFTLVEAIVVMVIVAVLAGVGIPFLMGYLNDSRIDAGRASIELVGAAIMQTHNRGIDIDANNWGDLGITDPSDDTWTFTFGGLAANATDPTVNSYVVTGTCKKCTGSPNSGTYSPNQTHGSRWTGIFDSFDN